jgi:hypothetical protein
MSPRLTLSSLALFAVGLLLIATSRPPPAETTANRAVEDALTGKAVNSGYVE